MAYVKRLGEWLNASHAVCMTWQQIDEDGLYDPGHGWILFKKGKNVINDDGPARFTYTARQPRSASGSRQPPRTAATSRRTSPQAPPADGPTGSGETTVTWAGTRASRKWNTAINTIRSARQALLAGLMILLAAGCSNASGGEQAVFALNSGFTTGLSGQTDEVQDIGLPLGWLHNDTSNPVRVTSVQFAFRPASLHVLNIYAYSFRENPHIGVISQEGELPLECPREFRPHPLSAAIFPPHSNGYWEVIIAFTISRPGIYHLNQVRLDYTTQGHHGWQYQNIFVTVTVKNPPLPGPRPLPPSAVC
jgi:hypothetical protein